MGSRSLFLSRQHLAGLPVGCIVAPSGMDHNESYCCPVCTLRSAKARFSIPDHEYGLSMRAAYAQCAQCGCLSRHPMPDESALAECYPAEYHSFAHGGFIDRIKYGFRLRSILAAAKKRSFVFLDFGCGDGSFLRYAADRLPSATFFGYEISSRVERIVERDGRIVIVRGGLSDLLQALPQTDVISLHHVIEHLPDPRFVMSALFGKLADSGCVMGQTPACDSLERRIFGRFWSGFHAPRHTVVFSRKALMQLLHGVGFSSVNITAAFNPAGIAVSLMSALHGDRPGHIRRRGFRWLAFVLCAVLLYPLDLLSGRSGVIDFSAKK